MNRNDELKVALEEVKKIAAGAKEEKDFDPAFSLLKEFRGKHGEIAYDNSTPWIIFFIFLGLGIAYGAILYLLPDTRMLFDGHILWGIPVFALGVIIPLAFIGSRGGEIDEISDKIFGKDVFFDNKLTKKKIEDKKALYRELRDRFGEFRGRGDEDRYIKRMAHGVYEGDELKTEYDYYVFHYVEVYYETVIHTDSKGNIYTTTERRTRTCYRYGLLLDFPFAENVALVSGGGNYDYPAEWNTASEEFNSRFNVYAQDEMTASKFLKPAVIPVCIEAKDHFDGLNVEIAEGGKMNIAFSDSDVLSLERKCSIQEPEEFEKEIKSALSLPKLKKLLSFVETLKKYNDSNF